VSVGGAEIAGVTRSGSLRQVEREPHKCGKEKAQIGGTGGKSGIRKKREPYAEKGKAMAKSVQVEQFDKLDKRKWGMCKEQPEVLKLECTNFGRKNIRDFSFHGWTKGRVKSLERGR